MVELTSTREAKQFLIDKIVGEAKREGVQCTEIENKMLYYSETAWTLPDMDEVNEAFDASYDSATYERKISDLIRNLVQRMSRESAADLKRWNKAVRLLKQEDHYLLVLIGIAEGRFSVTGSQSSFDWRYFLRVVLIVVVGSFLFLGLIVIYLHLRYF